MAVRRISKKLDPNAITEPRMRRLLAARTVSPVTSTASTGTDSSTVGVSISTTPALIAATTSQEPDPRACRVGSQICDRTATCKTENGTLVHCLCLSTATIVLPGELCPIVKNREDYSGVISNRDLIVAIVGPNSQSAITGNTTANPRLDFNETSGDVTNLTSWTSPSAAPHGVAATDYATVLVAVTLTGTTALLLLLALVCWMRRWSRKAGSAGGHADANLSGWYYCCLWRKAKGSVSLQALGKSGVLDGQQFTSNPNYYTSPPEMALLKSLLHLEIPGDKLAFLDVIGEGCFGKVFKGEFRKSENLSCEVAIKILKENSSNETQLDFLREVEIMSSFDHRNILTLLGVVVIENGATPWMVFEYMEFGDLAELLRENSSQFWSKATPLCQITKNDLPWIATQVASGMSYLNSQHFVHRDLATRNCLVGDNLAVKISDFGMSRDIYTCDYYKIGGSRLLPVRWMAPESVMYGKFTLESDIWSFGVVLWEIFAFGKQPYYGHSNEEVVKLIRQGILLTPPDDCPRHICQLMETCWKTNPYDRVRFPHILDHLSASCLKMAAAPATNGGDSGAITTSTIANGKSVYLNVDVHPADNCDTTDSQNYLVPRSAYM